MVNKRADILRCVVGLGRDSIARNPVATTAGKLVERLTRPVRPCYLIGWQQIIVEARPPPNPGQAREAPQYSPVKASIPSTESDNHKHEQPFPTPVDDAWRPQRRRIGADGSIQKLRTRRRVLPIFEAVDGHNQNPLSLNGGSGSPQMVGHVSDLVMTQPKPRLEHALQKLQLVSEARNLLQAQRDMVERLEYDLDRVSHDVADFEVQVRCAERARKVNKELLHRLRRDHAQLQEVAAYQRVELRAAKHRLSIGEERYGELEAQMAFVLDACLSNATKAPRSVDAAYVQHLNEHLFGPRQAKRLRLEAHGRSAKTTSGMDNISTLGAQMVEGKFRSREVKAFMARWQAIKEKYKGDRQEVARQTRDDIIRVLEAVRNAVDNWHKTYDPMYEKHAAGQNPGFPGWSASWSRLELDHAYLRERLRLTNALHEVRLIFRQSLERAMKEGLEPLEGQWTNFWQPGEFHYTESQERNMIEAAPVEEIMSWDDGFTGPDGIVPMRPAGEPPAGWEVEWPSAEADWEQDWMYSGGADLGPGDSYSCTFEEWISWRLEYATPRMQNQSWTLNNAPGGDQDQTATRHFL